MIPQNTVTEGDFLSSSNQTSNFGMEVSPEAFAILSSQIYQFKGAAVVREYCCNACDGHSAIDSTEPFTIRLPSVIDPFFVVVDNGIGLDDNGVRNVFAKYFKSTKKGTNKETGFLGLGAKSGYSYADTFTIEARKDGVERIYVAYFDAARIPALDKLSERKTSSPNGVTIKVPVDESDFKTFRRDAEFIASFTSITPVIEGGELWDSGIRGKLDRDGWAFAQNEIPYGTSSLYRIGSRDIGIVMGGVVYPVESRTVKSLLVEEGVSHRDNVYISFLDNISRALFVQVGMGEVEFAASRETLSFTPKTKETVSRYIRTIVDDILSEVKKKVTEFESPVLAYEYVRETLGYTPPLYWRGDTKISIVHSSMGKIFNIFNCHLMARESNDRVVEKNWHNVSLRRLYGNIKIVCNDTKRTGLKKYTRQYMLDNMSAYDSTLVIRMSKNLRPSQINRFKKMLGMSDGDFIKASDIIPLRKKKAQKSSADETSVRCCWYDLNDETYNSTDVIDIKSMGNVAYINRHGNPQVEDARLCLYGQYPSVGPSMHSGIRMLRVDLGLDAIIYMNQSNERKIKKMGIPSLQKLAEDFLVKHKDDAVKVMAQDIVNEEYSGLNMEKYDLLTSAKSIHLTTLMPKRIVSGSKQANDVMNSITAGSHVMLKQFSELRDEARTLAQPLCQGMRDFAQTIDNALLDHYPLLKLMSVGSAGSSLRMQQIEYIQLLDQKGNKE